MRKLSLLALAICAQTSSVFAADLVGLPLTALQQQAIENSLTLKTDQWNLQQRSDNLQVDWLDHAQITTSSTTQKQLDSDQPAQTVITVKADMDLTSKLNLSAQTNTEQQTALGVTYSPFASEYIGASDTEQYLLAQLTLSYDKQSLQMEVEQAVLALMEQQQALALAQGNVALTQSQEQAKRGSLALGVATVSDVAQASQNSVNAQQQLFNAQVNLLNAEQTLQRLVGVDVNLPTVTTEQLTTLVQKRAAQLATYSMADIDSKQTQQLAIQHQTLTSELNDIDFYNPDIRFTGEYDVDANAIKVGASFSFSKAQFGASAIMTLDQELQLKSTELLQQQSQLENNYRLLQQKLSLTETALESRLLEQAIYEQDLKEMQLLQAQGERTTLQVAQQRYLKQQADNNVFSALVTLYLAQNEFCALWP